MSDWQKMSFLDAMTWIQNRRQVDTAPKEETLFDAVDAADPLSVRVSLREVVSFPHCSGGTIYLGWGYEADYAYTPGISTVFYVREDPF